MVSLVKRDKLVLVYVTDGSDIDYYTAKLDNYDLFHLVGRAYALGYEDFEIGISVLSGHLPGDRDITLAKVRNGRVTVNWNYVGIAPLSAWDAPDTVKRA